VYCSSGNVCLARATSCPDGETSPGAADNPGTGGAFGDVGASGSGGWVPPPPPAKAYRLVQTRNIAAPLPDPTGVASDGAGLWILSGGQNSTTNTLVHFDPATGVADRSFQFQNLIEMLGSGAYGITWDGVAVWISVSGNTNKLVGVDPATG
jgi:hypothetical protein